MDRKFQKQEHEIFGGKAIVLRTKQSGDVWQFRMWVSEEAKYIRKTLKTRDLETAIKRAEEEYLKAYSDIASGKKLFGITLEELIGIYINYRNEDVKSGRIVEGRLNTIKSQLKHLVKYKEANINISELDRNSLFEWEQYRRNNDGAELVTIRNEISTINHMMNYAYRNGYSHFDKFEFRQFKINEVGRRDTFTLTEYDKLTRFMRSWSAEKNCKDAKELYYKTLVKDCVLIAANTMARVGELWQLRWGDIENIGEVEEGGEKLVEFNIRAETSKVRKSRRIITRGGEYFSRIYQYSIHKNKEDYIFADYENGNRIISRRILYDYWKQLMEGTNIDYKTRNITWYSLRSFGITCRLMAGNSIFEVAKIAGNSSSVIDKHYGHINQEMMRGVALKNFRVTRNGIVERE